MAMILVMTQRFLINEVKKAYTVFLSPVIAILFALIYREW